MIEFNLVNFQHSTGIVALNNIDVTIAISPCIVNFSSPDTNPINPPITPNTSVA